MAGMLGWKGFQRNQRTFSVRNIIYFGVKKSLYAPSVQAFIIIMKPVNPAYRFP